MKALLFDLDGTLVDSSIGVKSAFRYAFEQLNLPLPDDKTLSTFIGPPLEVTFANFFEEPEKIDLAINTYRAYYNEKGVYQVTLYPDILVALQALNIANYQLFVTTSKHENMAKLMLKELGISSYFKEIYGSLPNRYQKADVIQACLTEQKLIKDGAVIIGDTKFDIIGGKTVGIKTMGITWGFSSQKELEDYEADLLCHNPLDIEKALKSL